ncbi:hypothetical protein Pan258_30960 [Symmachiella dynata]|nr:hypothetical protein Pan258_30960 [Symmachiella dynata]
MLLCLFVFEGITPSPRLGLGGYPEWHEFDDRKNLSKWVSMLGAARSCDLFLPVKPTRHVAWFNGILHLMVETIGSTTRLQSETRESFTTHPWLELPFVERAFDRPLRRVDHENR